MHITRCILDTGWGRKLFTVNNNLLEVKINVIKCKDILMVTSYPSLVCHPVKNLLKIGQAVDMLMQSLYPGRLSAFAQLYTFRRSWSDFLTFCRAFIKGVLEGASLGEDHRRKTVLDKCSTHTIWFEIFL